MLRVPLRVVKKKLVVLGLSLLVVYLTLLFGQRQMAPEKQPDLQHGQWQHRQWQQQHRQWKQHRSSHQHSSRKNPNQGSETTYEFVQSPPDDGTADYLVDWHDTKVIEKEKRRTGPGEQGVAVQLPPDADKKEVDRLLYSNGYSGYQSDRISLYRAVKDLRHPQCRTQKYRRRLPTAAIVMPFFNDHLSTILRTVVSCRHRAPRELLREIILVDDCSTKPELKEPLDKFFKENFDNVFIIHNEKREGLIRTRLVGARRATADVLVVLDAHCECGINWLPPLLHPIAENPNTTVCPFIDTIFYDTFEMRSRDAGARGSWDWQFYYARLPLLPKDRENPTKPFDSPVMNGGLFAIGAKFFWDIGSYDTGLEIWGAEQFELSFKIWQCHGRMVDAPCSRIGHVAKNFYPVQASGVGIHDFLGRNHKRVAEVWMDEYKHFLYARNKAYFDKIDAGNLTEQKAVRQRLGCKSFDWFMKNVAFDQSKYFPGVEPPPAASGELRNVGNSLCIRANFATDKWNASSSKCLADGGTGDQHILLTFKKELRFPDKRLCLDVSLYENGAPVNLYSCHSLQGNQWWSLLLPVGQLKHKVTKKCLESTGIGKKLIVNDCDVSNKLQLWHFQHVNASLVKIDANSKEFVWRKGP